LPFASLGAIAAIIVELGGGIMLIIGFYGTMILCSIAMVMLFASARNLGPRVTRIAIGISVIALAFFGIYQLLTGIQSL